MIGVEQNGMEWNRKEN